MTQETPCPHHWIIDAPDGPASKGACRLCGAVQMFANSIVPDSLWRAGRNKAGRPRKQESDP